MTAAIGIDFGSLGWRAAYLDGEQVVTVRPEGAGLPPGWLLCERSEANGVGVAFASVKARLGQGATPGDGGPLADQLVVGCFGEIRAAVEARAGRPVGQAVVAVPARYSASRRAALREAGLRAGFAEIHLLNDSMAAVMSRGHGRDQAVTALVYGMGYAGFEIGLVRVARGHYRALGYEGADAPGGATLDGLILRTWLATLAERNLVIDTSGWGQDEFLRLQRAAQWTKETLAGGAEAVFPVAVTPSGGGEAVRMLLRSGLEEVVSPWLKATLDLVEKLIADANLAPGDIGELLMTGGTTLIPSFAAAVEERLGRKPVALADDALARGAALQGARVGSAPLAAGPAGGKESTAAEAVELPEASLTMRATLVAAPDGAGREAAGGPPPETIVALAPAPTAPAAPDARARLEPVRELLERGQVAPARAVLEALIREAQALLTGATQPEERPKEREANRVLAQAHRMLREGKGDEAVKQSHLAWSLAPEAPQIFDSMIDVHRQAALAADDVEGYADAQRWLRCAYQHDQSNMAVRQAIAERHYLHAKQMADRRRYAEAKAALVLCLDWSPDHEKGRDLQQALARR
jgi:hypothetical protein